MARAREEFEFGSRNARDIMRRTQRIIKLPSYPGYNSDSQLSVSNTSGFEVEDLLKSQDNNDRVNVTPTSNGRTELTQAMQDLQIENVLPETDPNLESHDEDIIIEAFGASLDKSTCLDHSIWTERWVKSVLLPKRLYTLPNGNIGRKYVDLLTHELKLLSTTADSTSERVLVMSRVLLRRDPMIKASKDIRILIGLGQRIEDWKENKFDKLLAEAVRCGKKKQINQDSLDDKHVSKVFASLLMKGNVRSAMRWLSERASGGVLDPMQEVKMFPTVLETLKSKHPQPHKSHLSSRLQVPVVPDFEDVIISSASIEKTARSLQGSSGASGTDSEHWQTVFLRHGAHSSHLRDEVATLATKMCNQILPWSKVRALVSGRMIALDNCPDVRPIGIGGLLRSIICKKVAELTKIDLEETCSTDQLACGLKAGVEGAIHALSDVFDDNKEGGCGMLLMDASNAFNSLNREAAFWNARVLWPRCSRFLFNTYRGFASLFVAGADEVIYSRDGTTQGDPLTMFFYGVSLLPMIRKLKDPNNVLESWYADDSAAIAKLKKLEIWLKNLIEEGPAFGFFPEPSKNFLIVDKQYAEEAHHIFDKYSITIVEANRFLSGFNGDGNEKDIFLKKKESEWVDKIEKFSFLAKTEPQCALSGLTKSLQAEWNFSHRILAGSSQLFQPLENLLKKKFLPAILGTSSISSMERRLFCLPAIKGGLGVSNPTSFADESYNTSREAVTVLYDALVDQHGFSHEDHRKQMSRSRKKHHQIMEEKHEELLGSY